MSALLTRKERSNYFRWVTLPKRYSNTEQLKKKIEKRKVSGKIPLKKLFKDFVPEYLKKHAPTQDHTFLEVICRSCELHW
jgi:hypothetical protein